jgi:hypothetical protein
MLLRCCLTLLPGLFLLSGCGGSSSNSDSGAPGANSNPYAQAMQAQAAPRYRMVNGCFAVQDAASGEYLQTTEADLLSMSGKNLTEATPFFMRPTALGQYAFYDPQARYMTLAASAEDIASGVETLISQLGFTVSGVGDFIDLNVTIHPASEAVDGVGEGITGGGVALADALRAGSRNLVMQVSPVDGSEWTVDGNGQSFSIHSTLTGDPLVVGDSGDSFRFVPHTGCATYPEAQLNAVGTPFSGTNPDGTVFGYAETHMHLGGTEMFGGKLGYGKPFHKFGIEHALGNCSEHHGPNGELGLVDIAVNPNQGPPQHETQGWPTYADWPSYGGQIHHQTYHAWLQRAWMGGLRLMVNHLVANEGLCLLWPIKGHDCNEMETIEIQRQLTLDLQDYIDAQAGGPGKGFFRIVYNSKDARLAIEAGQMAVILGTENEKIFDCGEFLDTPDCSEDSINRDMADWYARGIRAIFPIHLFDNAIGGARLTDDPALNALYSLGNLVDTGHPYATVSCDGPDNLQPGEAQAESRGIFDTILLMFTNPQPLPPLTGCQRNARSITPLGEFFINRMIDTGLMIETDHTGVLARNRMFDIAQARSVPVFSGHTGEISALTKDSDRILQTGGIISQLPDDTSTDIISFVQDLKSLYIDIHGSDRGLATGLGSDINGLHRQAKPRTDVGENPLKYPFKSFDGKVSFERQVTGERVYDLNSDGVAHYGLFPDLLADIQMQDGGDEALKYLFRSAEAYLQAWARVEAARITAATAP